MEPAVSGTDDGGHGYRLLENVQDAGRRHQLSGVSALRPLHVQLFQRSYQPCHEFRRCEFLSAEQGIYPEVYIPALKVPVRRHKLSSHHDTALCGDNRRELQISQSDI